MKIAYLTNSSFNEVNLIQLNPSINNIGATIVSITRQSISNSEENPTTPTITNIRDFTNQTTTMSNNDVYFSPYENIFCQSLNSMTNYFAGTTYHPSGYPSNNDKHSYLLIKLTTISILETFILSYTCSSTDAISSIWINWQSIGTWYNVNLGLSSGGCGLINYQLTTVTTTAPQIYIKSPNLLSNPNDSIYINFQFNNTNNAYINVNSLQISTPINDLVPSLTNFIPNVIAPLVTSGTISSNIGSLPLVYISGLPHFNYTSTITYAQNSIQLNNVYNIINPKLFLSSSILDLYFNLITSDGYYVNQLKYTDVINTTFNNTSTAIPINLMLSALSGLGTYTNFPKLNINYSIYNTQYSEQPGYVNFFQSIAFIPYISTQGSPLIIKDNIGTINIANYLNTNSVVTRYSVEVISTDVTSIYNLAPIPGSLNTNFINIGTSIFGSNISKDDMFYSPIPENGGAYFNNITTLINTCYNNTILPGPEIYAPNVSTGSHKYILYYITYSVFLFNFHSKNFISNIANILISFKFADGTFSSWYSTKYSARRYLYYGCSEDNLNYISTNNIYGNYYSITFNYGQFVTNNNLLCLQLPNDILKPLSQGRELFLLIETSGINKAFPLNDISLTLAFN
jgi:hypothetical protein